MCMSSLQLSTIINFYYLTISVMYLHCTYAQPSHQDKMLPFFFAVLSSGLFGLWINGNKLSCTVCFRLQYCPMCSPHAQHSWGSCCFYWPDPSVHTPRLWGMFLVSLWGFKAVPLSNHQKGFLTAILNPLWSLSVNIHFCRVYMRELPKVLGTVILKLD